MSSSKYQKLTLVQLKGRLRRLDVVIPKDAKKTDLVNLMMKHDVQTVKKVTSKQQPKIQKVVEAVSDKNLLKMTKPQLVAMCKSKGIVCDIKWLKADLIKSLEKKVVSKKQKRCDDEDAEPCEKDMVCNIDETSGKCEKISEKEKYVLLDKNGTPVYTGTKQKLELLKKSLKSKMGSIVKHKVPRKSSCEHEDCDEGKCVIKGGKYSCSKAASGTAYYLLLTNGRKIYGVKRELESLMVVLEADLYNSSGKLLISKKIVKKPVPSEEEKEEEEEEEKEEEEKEEEEEEESEEEEEEKPKPKKREIKRPLPKAKSVKKPIKKRITWAESNRKELFETFDRCLTAAK